MTQTVKEPRNVGVVISEMIEVIPVEQEQLLGRMKYVLNNAAYRAPEQQGATWEELSLVLVEEVKPPLTSDWQVRLLSIFSTEPEDAIRTAYCS